MLGYINQLKVFKIIGTKIILLFVITNKYDYTMKLRTIKEILPAFKINMGGIVLDQALPHQKADNIDPFLLLHHLDHQLPEGQRPQEAGVPPHPHRGFAPVSFIFKGGVHHRDSRDNDSIIYEGGTQWMNAGMGIVHSERPPVKALEEASKWELIQFWVNVPAKFKMDQPEYLPLTYDETPRFISEDGKVNIGVVAGEFIGITGGVATKSPIMALRLELEKDGEIEIPIPKDYNAFIYQLDGDLTINGNHNSKPKDLIWLENQGEGVKVKANATTRAILLSGLPINETIEAHGPFVMNNKTEIMQAMRDYQMGKMGVLVEEFD